MADRTLGDVPGLDDLLPSTTELLPSDYSVLEVNGIGEITGDQLGLGDMGMGPMGGDPFAPQQGWAERDAQDAQATAQQYATSDPMTSSYMPSINNDGTAVSSSGVGSFSQEQVDNAATIAEVGKNLGASSRDIQIALMAAIVESGLRSLPFGDRDSVGMFQQRDAWGSSEDRLDPAKSAEMFFKGGAAGQRGLLDIEDRNKMGMGEAAQAVQVSAFPDRYAEHEGEAAELLGAVSGGNRNYGEMDGKNPYDLTEFDGKTVDNITAAALDAAGKELGGGFRIMQGSHNEGGVAASGGTHDGGGVVDLAPENGDWEGAVRALRKMGFAAWARNIPGHGSAGSGAHIHAVLIGNKELSAQARTQVNSYLHNDDGLSGSRPDDGPRDFVNNRFVWGKSPEKASRPDERETLLKHAQTFLGTPFKWGGADYDGVDGAGFVEAVYKKLGAQIPKDLDDLIMSAKSVSIEEAQKGDMVGWTTHPGTGGGHAGVYLGNGLVLDSAGPGRVVQITALSEAPGAFAIPLNAIPRGTPTEPAAHITAAPRPVRPTAPKPARPPMPGVGALNPAKPHTPA